MTIDFKNKIFSIRNSDEFRELTLALFNRQAKHNPIYKRYIEAIHVDPSLITEIEQIPFLPISFFKSHEVRSTSKKEEIVFTSSGTTGQVSSKHYVSDLDIYRKSFSNSFELFYGSPKDYCILALLPAYLERKGSSLVYMADQLIKESNHPLSGFHLKDHYSLRSKLNQLKAEGQKTLLIGVSFGLLDFIEEENFDWSDLTVMETGGMKGRRKEMIRSELHAIFKEGFHVKNIHSEYGMTELLSQAYSKGEGLYTCPPWMKVMTRETADPFSQTAFGQTGGLNVIDLANIDSCAFIATEDLAKVYEDGRFEVLGRFDEAEVRGCNLMV